jgi:uncharacterized protein (DUF1015 family)
MLDKITEQMKTESMFIADGHHRYEVSCAYRDEMRKKKGEMTGEEDFNYTLAVFHDISITRFDHPSDPQAHQARIYSRYG